MLHANTEKVKIFFEVARALNRYRVIPILFGSLGLYRVIEKLERRVNDIDILIPDEVLGEKWTQLLKIVNELGFVLKDEREHEFVRNGEIIAFGKASDLVRLAGIDFKELKTTDEDGAKFKELSPEQYLHCYRCMLRDRYRQEKRGSADKEKGALIEKYLHNTKRVRAVAVIVNNDKVLLMHRIKNGKEYYVFPGGGVEDGETVEQAVLREVQEETSLEVKVKKLLYHHMYADIKDEHFFYLCRYISGEPKLGNANESQEMVMSDTNFYRPLWFEIKDLPQLLLYPLEIRDWFIEDMKTNFKNAPRTAALNSSSLRQTL